jgi:hypothetical protein
MKFLSTRVVYSVLFYSLTQLLLVTAKPSVIFERNGDIKPFGVGSHKTMFSYGVFSVVLAILCFYVFALIDLVFQ